MSKLSHSHQPTMDEIDRKRAIEDGNEDLIPREPMTAIEIEMFQKWAASKPRFLVDLVHLGLVPKDLAAANIDLRQHMDERLLATIAAAPRPTWKSISDLPVDATMNMIRQVDYGTWLVSLQNHNGRDLPAVVWGRDKPEMIMVVEPPSNAVIEAHRKKVESHG